MLKPCSDLPGLGLFPSIPTPEHGGCAVGAMLVPGGTDLTLALTALRRMEHRGSGLPDARGRFSGDGAGILMRLPWVIRRWLATVRPDMGERAFPWEGLGVGVFFLPSSVEESRPLERRAELLLRGAGVEPLAWRDVPTDPEGAGLGARARSQAPRIRQLFIAPAPDMDGDSFERELLRIRKLLEAAARGAPMQVTSLSCRLLNYKGMLTSDQLPRYFPDLTAWGDEAISSDIVVFHRRFSTNTYPNWFLAQPFRLLAHNGEINAIAANRAAVHTIERLANEGPERGAILMPGGSDSADLDQVVEYFMHRNGDLALTLQSLIPPAWRPEAATLPPMVIRFHQYFKFRRMALGQWEGPAGILATDGRVLVAKEDRIGLRPLRWSQREDGAMFIASEAGAFPLEPERISHSGKLGFGQLMRITLDGTVHVDADLLEANLHGHPHLRKGMTRLRLTRPRTTAGAVTPPQPEVLARDARLHAFSPRHRALVEILMTTGAEPVVAMGKAVPAAGLSPEPSSIYDFFLQKFAQITNPPIDFVREKRFFDLHIFVGDRARDQGWELNSPILNPETMAWMEARGEAMSLSVFFTPQGGRRPLARACRARLAALLEEVIQGVREGFTLFILHDDDQPESAWPMPGPLLISYLRMGLIQAGLRHRCALVLKLRDMREPHDVAVNLACGAHAVHPTLIWQVAAELETNPGGKWPAGRENLQAGLDKALLKIIAKMGVTSIVGYRASKLFMPFGLGPDVLKLMGWEDPLSLGGRDLEGILALYRLRLARQGRRHAGTWEESKACIARAAADASPLHLEQMERERGRAFKPLHRLAIVPSADPVTGLQEGVEEIVARYLVGAAMSHGALKEEAHCAVAAAFHDLGGLSNCGEGGEDPHRDHGRFHSRIRQVASGRFGVEARYLVHADELQIKIAQGAKPGEGGQLMGVKVDHVIARNRHCAPGTTLISPQTHQDIYSIEDLKQLVHDLKAINPEARISVKIAAETGIGIIAVGAAKMPVEIIEIDGLDGGTAATPESSREHAAHYAEVGLVEAHHALTRQGVRPWVRLRVASGVKSGADVIKYLLLGADEVALGTALMVAQGCVVCAQCHTGVCPVAISGVPRRGGRTTPELERRIQRVTNYLRALAGDAARIAGTLGVSRLAELTGRVGLLRALPAPERTGLHLERLLVVPAAAPEITHPPPALYQSETMAANRALLARFKSALERGSRRSVTLTVGNGDLSFGATLAGAMARRWPEGYPPGKRLRVKAGGDGGQKFGFGCVTGLEIHLDGVTNDTPGAAMSGGVLVVAPSRTGSEDWVTAGNAVGYGATGGEIDIKGRVGERCAIRNSGASIVVGGANDFLAEYQTGGETICLSPPGREVGAGMTGGRVFLLLGEGGEGGDHMAPGVVRVEPTPEQWRALRGRLARYARRTDSAVAQGLLADWVQVKRRFGMWIPVALRA